MFDTAVATHREELEEGILEHLPLLVLIGNHWNVNFAEVLGEQEDQADRAVGKTKGHDNMCHSHPFIPRAWSSPAAPLAFFGSTT